MAHFDAFKRACLSLAQKEPEHFERYGIKKHEIELVRGSQPWRSQDLEIVDAVIIAMMNAAITVANIPLQPLPGSYVAMVIATNVHPNKWQIAATRDVRMAMAAGVDEELEYPVEPLSYEQKLSFIMLYGGGSSAQRPNMIVRNVEPISAQNGFH